MQEITDVWLVLVEHINQRLLSKSAAIDFGQNRLRYGGFDLQGGRLRPGETQVIQDISFGDMAWSAHGAATPLANSVHAWVLLFKRWWIVCNRFRAVSRSLPSVFLLSFSKQCRTQCRTWMEPRIRVRYITLYHVRASPSFSSQTPFPTDDIGRWSHLGRFPF